MLTNNDNTHTLQSIRSMCIYSAVLSPSYTMRKLPLGIQSFEYIRTDNRIYIDKTQHIYNLIFGHAKSYFLARPRRFGKSLLVDTIRLLFQGRKELFT